MIHRSIEISLPSLDETATVDYHYYAGCAGRYYMSNGDPGYPAEPEEIDIISVKARDIDIYNMLSSFDIESIEEQISEYESGAKHGDDYDDE